MSIPGAWVIWNTPHSLQNTKYHKTLDLLTCPNSPTTIMGVGLSSLLELWAQPFFLRLPGPEVTLISPRNDLKAGFPLGTEGLKSTEVTLPGGKWASFIFSLPQRSPNSLGEKEVSLRPQEEDVATHNNKR